jgi:hypothetical protein
MIDMLGWLIYIVFEEPVALVALALIIYHLVTH